MGSKAGSTNRLRIITWLLLLFCGSALGINIASAEDGKASPPQVALSHLAPYADELPDPGAKLLLSVSHKASKDLDARVELYAVRDGKLSRYSSIKTYLNEADEATFDFNLYSPLVELNYYFVYYSNKGQPPQVSRRYSLRRSCLPDITLTKILNKEEQNSLGVQERMQVLLDESKSLEKDLANYENIAKQIDIIKAGLPKPSDD